MPYTDDQIETLNATDPAIIKEAYAKMTADQQADLSASVDAYNSKKQAPSQHSAHTADWQKEVKHYTLANGSETRIRPQDDRVWLDDTKGQQRGFQGPGWYKWDDSGKTWEKGPDNPRQFWNNLIAGAAVGMAGVARPVFALAHATGLYDDETYNVLHESVNAATPEAAKLASESSGFPRTTQMAGNVIAQAPLNTLMPGGSLTQKGIQATEAGPMTIQAIRAVQAANVAKAAFTGGAMTALQPTSTPGQIATGAAAGPVAQYGSEKVVTPIMRGAANAVKGWLGKSVTPDVSKIANQFGKLEDQRSGTEAQSLLNSQYEADRAKAAAPFQALRANGGTIDPQPYIDSIDKSIQDLQDSRRSDVGNAIQALTALKTHAEKGPLDWNSALSIGTELNDRLHDATNALMPYQQDRNLARLLIPVKQGLQSAMDQAGASEGQAYRDAKHGWQELVVPWEDPKQGARYVQKYLDSPNPNDAMKAMSMLKPDAAKNLLKVASPEAKAAIQTGVAEEAIRAGQDPLTGAMDPARTLKAINDRESMIGLTFSGEDKWKWDGFKKLMMGAYQFDRFIPGDKLGMNSSEIAAKLFTTKTGSNFLLGLSDMNPTSKKFSNAVNQTLPKILGMTVGKAGQQSSEGVQP